MKYIRTKDGRILIAPNLYDNGGIVLCSEPPMYETRDAKNEWGCVFCHDVINQADTIEELGDIYVIVPKDGKSKPYTLNTLSGFDDIKDVLKRNDIYLSIWVDALLKPMAKMNEKGELELL